MICFRFTVAPPPKIAAPRRLNSVTTGNGLNGNTDLFGSDPFELNNAPNIFKVSFVETNCCKSLLIL